MSVAILQKQSIIVLSVATMKSMSLRTTSSKSQVQREMASAREHCSRQVQQARESAE